jgi:hypothetical protein
MHTNLTLSVRLLVYQLVPSVYRSQPVFRPILDIFINFDIFAELFATIHDGHIEVVDREVAVAILDGESIL